MMNLALDKPRNGRKGRLLKVGFTFLTTLTLVFSAVPSIIFADASASETQGMTLDSMDGPVSQKEIDSFKTFMNSFPLPVDNYMRGNDFVYGPSGQAAEALGIVYEITGDTAILDKYVEFSDHMLAARNDPDTGRILWNGKRELTWPNKKPDAPDAGYSATENGDIIAHIANSAKLILQQPELWNRQVPDGDPFHFGKTYLERAKTYVKEMDRTIDTYMIPYLVNPDTLRQYWPSDPEWAKNNYGKPGTPIPWNQQMMINGGFQRLAECHELLGDDPERVAKYDRIIQTSIDWFLSDLTLYQKDGHDVYTWYYQALDRGKVEEFKGAHAAYDLLGLYRAYERGKYGITPQILKTFADTIQYVIDAGNGEFYFKVNADPESGTFTNVWSEHLYMTLFNHEVYPILTAGTFSNHLPKDPEYFARVLWVKWQLSSPSRILKQVASYEQSGDLPHAIAKQLANSLNQAQHQYELGHQDQAIKQLDNALKHLDNPGVGASIPEGVKSGLKADINGMISFWSSH